MNVPDPFFIENRFQKPAIKNNGVRWSAASILSLLVLFVSSYSHFSKLKQVPYCRATQRFLVPTTSAKPSSSAVAFIRKQLTSSCYTTGTLIERYYSPKSEEIDSGTKTEGCGNSNDYALWPLVGFAASTFGSFIGIILEIVLFLHGEPFNFSYSPILSSIVNIRRLVYAFIVTATALTTFALTIDPIGFPQRYLAFSLFASFLLGFLTTALYFDKEPTGTFALLAIIMISQVLWIFSNGTILGGDEATYFLKFGALSHLLRDAFFFPSTPEYSTIYHLLASITSWVMYRSLALVCNVDPTYTATIAQALVPNQVFAVSLIVSFLAGHVFILMISRATYQAWRSMTSYILWSSVYLLLLSAPRLRHPVRLSEVYREQVINRREVRPYSEQHSAYMPKPLGIPSINGPLLLSTVEIFASIRKFLQLGFAIVAFLNNKFPQANVNYPLKYKERMKVWEDGSKYFPASFFGLNWKMPKKTRKLQATPQPMLDAYEEGKLLAHMCQYGAGNSFLRRAVEQNEYPFFKLVERGSAFNSQHGLVLDLSQLDQYETKTDYEPYGGIAFFFIKDRDLVTKWVIEPRSKSKTAQEPSSASFRRIEEMIRVSLIFCMAAGKHVAEIHMALNLLEIALHNSFDYDLNPHFQPGDQFIAHPFRLVLYIHLFSHGLISELQVCHVLQEGAVLNQVFALTHNSMCEYLTNAYDNFRYGEDEDFAERSLAMHKLLHLDRGCPSFTCALQWELEYHDIFDTYANSVVGAMYANDKDVRDDDAMRRFVASISSKLDDNSRYGTRKNGYMQTKAEIKNFVSDTIFHIIVKHQLYGTDGLTGMLDPRINSFQIPKDGGPPAIDEWRSLVFAAFATAHPTFSLLLQDQMATPVQLGEPILSDLFRDATPINRNHSRQDKEMLITRLRGAWDQMQLDLRNKNIEWEYKGSGERAQNDENYMYCRCLPAELRTSAGY